VTPTPDTAANRRVIVLGSTGSIGVQAIEVIEQLNREHGAGRFPFQHEIVALAAGSNAKTLFEQANVLGICDLALAANSDSLDPPSQACLRQGADAAEQLVREVDADLVLGAMVGAAGLPATLAAIELGRDVALANKETLVAAGELVVPAIQRAGVQLLPIDSEHSAMWQSLPESICPPCELGAEVARIIITASGGPFRTWAKEDAYNATPEQALAHPTWSMGAKITIDCASLINKALEIIETRWLFGVIGDRIDVVIHPQSIIHSFVEYTDGSVLAQLGAPDMRTPIQWALSYPHRAKGVSDRLDFAALSQLDFQQPDPDRFPALALAYDVIDKGGVAGAVFNAANEAAVTAFLNHTIPFGRIVELAGSALRDLVGERQQLPLTSLDQVLTADREARRYVNQTIEKGKPSVTITSGVESAPATE
jgi:1-deoxy-D-xylulose-5-phosphate reductoisomerase